MHHFCVRRRLLTTVTIYLALASARWSELAEVEGKGFCLFTSTVADSDRLVPLILASLFRQPSPRSPVPPSSFPSGLQPVDSKTVNGTLHRRVSRTELDFEQALRGQDTVLIKESLDVEHLGLLDVASTLISPSKPPPSSASSNSSSPAPKTPHTGFQPATPTVVPPTPSPTRRPAALATGPTRSSTSSSSGREVFYDAQEDTDLQTKRRSMYRSPGTASSPDLATLLKKTRTREAASRERSRDGRAAVVTPGSTTQLTPNRLVARDDAGPRAGRQRSAGTSPNASPSSSTVNVASARSRQRPPPVPVPVLNTGAVTATDWILTSPRSMSSMRDGASGKVSVWVLSWSCVCGSLPMLVC
jgi:PH and SEC7 domain-containing protein